MRRNHSITTAVSGLDSGAHYTGGRAGAVVGKHSVIISPPVTISTATNAVAGNIGSRPGDEVDLPDSVRLVSAKSKDAVGLSGPAEVSFDVPAGGTQTALINVQSGR